MKVIHELEYTIGKTNLKKFRKRLRQSFGSGLILEGKRITRSVPKKPEDIEYVEVFVHTSNQSHGVKFRIAAHTLYVHAFQRKSDVNGTWHMFEMEDMEKMIPGAQMLPWGVQYRELRDFSKLTLCRATLENSVIALDKSGTKMNDWKLALMRLTIFLSEGSRLKELEQRLFEVVQNHNDIITAEEFEDKWKGQIHGWSANCKAFAQKVKIATKKLDRKEPDPPEPFIEVTDHDNEDEDAGNDSDTSGGTVGDTLDDPDVKKLSSMLAIVLASAIDAVEVDGKEDT